MSKAEKAKHAEAPQKQFRAKNSYEDEFPKMDGKRPFSETINKSLTEVSAVVGNAKKLPEFLEHLEQVEMEKGDVSAWHFRGKGPDATQKQSFKTKKEGNAFTYSSEDSLGFAYELHLELLEAPGGRGTIVRMEPAFETGAGAAAAKLESLFGADAGIHAKKTLQRLKAYCETGHVPTIEGQSSGREE